jgi:hypothetical protein
VFYAQGDENAFFSWLKSIESVTRVVGAKRSLILTMAHEKLAASDFRELVALFERYRIGKRCLRPFVRKNASWARNKNLYWYAEIFGSVPRRKTR